MWVVLEYSAASVTLVQYASLTQSGSQLIGWLDQVEWTTPFRNASQLILSNPGTINYFKSHIIPNLE
ncbi:MAG TPA: hypothetical protein VLI05_03435 [Candidatus Saccharimonadia bacterium]|nr:hypothetical protein [Candidatus Saccharimonadia bacterium]